MQMTLVHWRPGFGFYGCCAVVNLEFQSRKDVDCGRHYVGRGCGSEWYMYDYVRGVCQSAGWYLSWMCLRTPMIL